MVACLSMLSHPCPVVGSCTCSTKLDPAAEELKNQGNRAFFEHKNHDAVERYSAALRRAPHSAVLLTNRWVRRAACCHSGHCLSPHVISAGAASLVRGAGAALHCLPAS